MNTKCRAACVNEPLCLAKGRCIDEPPSDRECWEQGKPDSIDRAMEAERQERATGLGVPATLPESMSRDAMLKYYSDYANMICGEVTVYQKRIRDLEEKLAARGVTPSHGSQQ